MELILKDEVYAIIGAAIEVHRVLGPGFLEAVYQEALTIELQDRNIPNDPQRKLPISYKAHVLQKHYVTDFVCYDCIMVEIKAEKQLTGADEAQPVESNQTARRRFDQFRKHGKTRVATHCKLTHVLSFFLRG